MPHNRKLKFRCWDKQKKCFFLLKNCLCLIINPTETKVCFMTKQGPYPIPDTGQKDLGLDRFILQQFTGLEDKNGKEICEGDILLFKNGYIDSVSWISQKDGYDWTGFVFGGTGDSFFESKIIGNIFENPDLNKNYKLLK